MNPFTLNVPFPTSRALEDKIEIQLGDWYLDFEDVDGFQMFKHHLACPPKSERDSVEPISGESPRHGTFFGRPGEKGEDFFKLQIRKASLRLPGKVVQPPLCAGYLHFRREDPSAPYTFRVCLSLFLNLARFIRHQPVDDESPPPPQKKTKPWLRYRLDSRYNFASEATLVKDDNWIPSTSDWEEFANPEEGWHFRRYVENLVNYVKKDIARAVEYVRTGQEVTHKFSEHYRLRTVETFWEFASDNSIEDVKILESQSKNLRKGDATSYYRDVTGTGRRQNSPCLSIKLRRNSSLRIYAKTCQRIRFEVIQESISEYRHELLKGGEAKKSYRPYKELFQLMSAARKKAKRLVEAFAGDLAASYGPHPRPCTALEFLAVVSQSVPPYANAHDRELVLKHVLSCLLENQGWVNAIPPQTSLGAALSILSQKGVISHSKKLQGYQIGERYRMAVMALRNMRDETTKILLGLALPKYRRAVRDR